MSIARSQMNRQLYNMGGEGIMQVAPQQQAQGEQYRPQAEALAQDPQKAIEVIVQMLVEQGIPLEEAKKIAMQMLQAVAEGGFENLEDEQRVEARFGGRIGYAEGGIGRLVDREQYGFGSVFKSVSKAVSGVVKGVTSAVKKVASSPIGRIALTVAAGYYLGPVVSGFSSNPFIQGALRGGLANLAVQAASGQKINFGEALTSAALGGVTQGLTQGTTGVETGAAQTSNAGFDNSVLGNPTLNNATINQMGEFYTGPTLTSVPQNVATGYDNIAGAAQGEFASGIDYTKAAQNVAQAPSQGIIDTLKTYGKDLYGKGIDLVKEYPKTALAGALGTGALLGGAAAPQAPNPDDYTSPEEYQKAVAEYENLYKQYTANLGSYQGLSLPTGARNPYYAADGGRIGYQMGGIGNIIQDATKQAFFKTPAMMANGGRIGYAFGSVDEGIMAAPQIAQQMGMPVGNPRQNEGGVTELDYRDEGGFVPPIGVKEREDDIPAMLSNNEFVFTADAVKNAGGGDPNVGAQKMYTLMKRLESGGIA